jgi:hypothetical protein
VRGQEVDVRVVAGLHGDDFHDLDLVVREQPVHQPMGGGLADAELDLVAVAEVTGVGAVLERFTVGALLDALHSVECKPR